VAYQARELAGVNRPQSLLAYNLKPASRGEPDRIRIPAGARNFVISLELTDAAYPAYRCVFYDASARLRFSVDSPAPPAGAPLSILVPVRSVAPGEYTLRVLGLRDSLAGPEVTHYSFETVTQ
jgi:hypothetical protein